MSSEQPRVLYETAHSLQKKGYSFDEIMTQLRAQGAPDNLLTEIVDRLKKICQDRRRNTGFICLGVGAFLLAAGFLLTLLLYHSTSSMRVAMYGLTTIGVIFVFKGLIDLTGW